MHVPIRPITPSIARHLISFPTDPQSYFGYVSVDAAIAADVLKYEVVVAPFVIAADAVASFCWMVIAAMVVVGCWGEGLRS